jgi:hypothetical protein
VAGGQRLATTPPTLPPDVPQYYTPIQRAGDTVTFVPRLFIEAGIRFADDARGVDVSRDVAITVPLVEGPVPLNWDSATSSPRALKDLSAQAPVAGSYRPLPRSGSNQKSYEIWAKEFIRWASQAQSLDVFWNPRAKVMSRPGETEGEFRIRCRQAEREQRDSDVERLRQQYGSRLAAQADRVRRAETAESREAQQAMHQKLQTALSFGATLVGALLGRKGITTGTIGRATTAARGVGRSMKESEDVTRALQTVQAEKEKLAALEQELQGEIARMDAGTSTNEPLEKVTLRPKRGGVVVKAAVLVWDGNAE